jgi:hypothetical protein
VAVFLAAHALGVIVSESAWHRTAGTRRLLVEELDIQPGRGLQDLERAILRHDPALELRPLAALNHHLGRSTVSRRTSRSCAGMQPKQNRSAMVDGHASLGHDRRAAKDRVRDQRPDPDPPCFQCHRGESSPTVEPGERGVARVPVVVGDEKEVAAELLHAPPPLDQDWKSRIRNIENAEAKLGHASSLATALARRLFGALTFGRLV